jgi:hypothetical protein
MLPTAADVLRHLKGGASGKEEFSIRKHRRVELQLLKLTMWTSECLLARVQDPDVHDRIRQRKNGPNELDSEQLVYEMNGEQVESLVYGVHRFVSPGVRRLKRWKQNKVTG